MKKSARQILCIVLTGLLVFVSLAPGFVSAKAQSNIDITAPLIKPVTLQNIKYIYQQNVKKVDLSKYIEKEGAILPPTGTDLTPGSILVDEKLKSSYYVQGKNPDGTLILRKPTMSEVFENFEIPKQTVTYNESNIIDLQPSIYNARKGIANPSGIGNITIQKIPETNDASGSPPQQKVASLSSAKEKETVEKALAGGWEYGFANSKLDAYFEDGTKLSVTLSGKVKAKMAFNVDYSMFGGYEFGVTAGQIIGLKAALEVKVKREIYIPIIGIDIDFNIGGVRAGLFLVVGIDGKITLVVAAEEGTSFEAGIRGGTCFGIPTSIKPFQDSHAYYSAECDPNGRIEAYAYLTPSITVNVLGIDVFKAEIRVGFYAYAAVEGPFLNYGVDAVVQFYVAVLGKGKHIINSRFTLFSRKKEAPPGGYYFYGDLCAFRDDAIVAVYKAKEAGDIIPEFIKDPFADKLPYVGQVQLYFYKANNTTAPYKIVTTPLTLEDKGVINYNFNANDGIDVVKGDSYRIVIPNNAEAFSSNVFSTMPFKGIKLDKADFYNEFAVGQVKPVSTHRDMPGWALADVKAEGKLEQLFCANKTATIRFVEPDGKLPVVSQPALTDVEGKFRLENYDIRPFQKAVPYINLDGFEIEGVPIDTTAGIYCIVGSDYLSSPTAEKITSVNDNVNSGDVRVAKTTVNSFDQLEEAQAISFEAYTSGDHILAVNEYGTKKIDKTVNYNINAYYVKDIEKIYSLAFVASKVGATVDLRDMIMKSTSKQLIYNDQATISLNEGNNSQIELFQGNVNEAAKLALQEGQPLSSSHAYHRLLVRDEKYFAPTVIGRTTVINNIINTIPMRRMVASVKTEVNKSNFADITDPLQQKGLDATITLNMAGSELTHGYATGSIYVDTKASFDIEGYTLYAEQADPWILKGQKQATNGISAEDMLKNEIQRFMQEGVLYFKRFVINPTQYDNTKLGTWRPSANTVKHELIVDYAKGFISLDGMKIDKVSRGSMVKGKLYLPATTLVRMMGGSSSFHAKTGKLTLVVGSRNVVLNTSTSTKSAVVAGKAISFNSEVKGNGKNILLSTTAITKMFGVNAKLDTKKSTVTVSFKGN